MLKWHYAAILISLIMASSATASAYSISEGGLSFIANHEGIVLNLYNDGCKGKCGDCTIGVGHLVHKGVCKLEGASPASKNFLMALLKNKQLIFSGRMWQHLNKM